MKKYINLFIKDITVYRNIFLFFAAFTIYMNFLTFFLFPIDQVAFFANISLLETSIFFTLYKLECQKNQGEKFLLITHYTRKDIIISRYILAFLCVTFEFLTYFCGKFLICRSKFIISSILSQLFLSFIINLILLPLSFKKNIKWLSIGFLVIIYIFWNFIVSEPHIFVIIGTPINFVLSLLSLKLSTKIFFSQDI